MTAAFLTSDQVTALRDLTRLWKDVPLALIGASALKCFVDMEWRGTQDLELSVSISMDEYPGPLVDLPGWKRHPHLEHEWLSPDQVRVDIVPSGDEHLEAGEIIWPESGLRMSLVGMRLAFERATTIEIEEGFEVRVAAVPVVAVLKMAAYTDRPSERGKDLQDLSHLLEKYEFHNNDRRYSDQVLDTRLDFEDVSAFLLGNDIGNIVGDVERETVVSFIARVVGGGDKAATQARMLGAGPVGWRNDPTLLLSRIRAFELGLGR